jgi:AraC-like DNA-binding protein
MFSGAIQQQPLLADSLILQTKNVEEAASLLATSAIPYQSELVSRASTFATQIFGTQGLGMHLSRVKTSGALRVHSQLPEDSYVVVLAISGELEHHAAGEIVPVKPGCGFVGSPAQQVEVETPEKFEIFFVRFSSESIVAELQKLLLREINVPLVFSSRFELSSQAGQRYRQSVMRLCGQLEGRTRRAGHETHAFAMAKSLITLLLEGHRHNYTRLLARAHAADPWQVRAAEEYIRANLDLPLSLGDICLAADVSARTLQHSFRRKRGYTPMEFLRKLRLERVRDELCRMERNVSVTEAALNCGFSHLGRFARDYRAHFGEKPSETLSRARPRK